MDANQFLVETARRLERDLGLKEHFLEDLIDERDDWSFVIKTHAFIESALTHLIVVALDQPALREVVARMPVDGRTSKLAFVGALDLLPNNVVAFIKTLGEMRNRFAHSPRNVGLRIEEWAQSEGKNNKWWEQLCAFTEDWIAQSNGEARPAEFVRQQPRAATLVSALHTASVIYQKAFAVESARTTERARLNDLEAIALRAIGAMEPEE